MDYKEIKKIRQGDKQWEELKYQLRWWDDEWTIGLDAPISRLKVTGLYKSRDKIKTKYERYDEHWKEPSQMFMFLRLLMDKY